MAWDREDWLIIAVWSGFMILLVSLGLAVRAWGHSNHGHWEQVSGKWQYTCHDCEREPTLDNQKWSEAQWFEQMKVVPGGGESVPSVSWATGALHWQHQPTPSKPTPANDFQVFCQNGTQVATVTTIANASQRSVPLKTLFPSLSVGQHTCWMTARNPPTPSGTSADSELIIFMVKP